MISFYNIFAIAKYERRILLRSWFFRIFAILSLLIIGIYSGATLFDKNPFTWMFRSLPSALIYSNMFLLNIFQSVIAVFLATDFLKRDKKLNTSEVLFIRPMTNLEYIFGKTLGLISVFLILNLLVVLLTSIFLLISNQVVFQITPILLYLFLVSVPTLVFIIGISYAIMIIIKNQPVAFILLLGYIALVLFYLGDKVGFLFDYMVFVKPLPYSDIIGFSNLSDVLFHRLSYLILGASFIFFTAWRLNRLAHSRFSNWNLAIVSLVLLLIASYGFYHQYQSLEIRKEKRIEYASIASNNFDYLVPEMKKASIVFEYGNEIKAQSTMFLENNTGSSIDTLLFSINPGLKVIRVMNNDSELAFKQNLLVVKVPLSKTMNDNDELSILIEYEGVPDFDVAYLDNEDEDVFDFVRLMSLRIDQQYGFYNKNFVLLTKENLWYPVPGIAYDPSRPAIFRQQFTNFDLTVHTKPDMLPISQGISSTSDSINYHFKTRDPLSQLSLTIGNYETKNVEVEGIDVQLAYIKDHDFFTEHLDELKDTIDDLVLEFLDDFERPLGLYYPYQVFSLVEVPAQFNSQAHSWTASLAQSQPQMIYLPEWGFNVRQLDFKSNSRRIKKNSERNKEGLTEKEIQAKVFTNFMKGLFAENNADMRFDPTAGSQSNPYSIFPNYFYYVNYITSEECPVLNYAFESYLMKGEDDPRQMFMSRMTGINDGEKANLLLKDKSLEQIIAEEDDQEAVNRVLKAKGSYLLTWMEKQIDNDDFQQYLFDYLYNNSYKEIKYTEMAKSFSNEFNFEMGSFISDWYTQTG
ncbi:MAG: hypothetical protein PF541_04375, partial [Prolixibacteraceae bacterium]|nr:hypothetical protein [Prolixibacteraceae bacterium]